MNSFELEDINIWRIRNPSALGFTHRQNSKSGITIQGRLFLTSRELAYNISETEIITGKHWDHATIMIKVKTTENAIKERTTGNF